MYPVLLGEGIWALPSYFTMLLVGFVFGIILLQKQAVKSGWNAAKIIDLSLFLVIASLVGARFFHILFDGYLTDYVHLCFSPEALGKTLPSGQSCVSDAACLSAQNRGADIGALCQDGLCVPEKDCLRVFKIWSGGLTYYGGFLFAVATAYFFARRWKWNFLELSDMAAPSIALGLGFGRIGCFLAGCCFGARTDLPWGMKFPQHSDAWQLHAEHYMADLNAQYQVTGVWQSLPVHPTQLYEAIGAFLIFIYLYFFLSKKKAVHGYGIAMLMILYAILRFTIEIVRADARGVYILSTSQWISIPLLIAGVALIVWQKKYSQKEHDNGDAVKNEASAKEGSKEEAKNT